MLRVLIKTALRGDSKPWRVINNLFRAVKTVLEQWNYRLNICFSAVLQDHEARCLRFETHFCKKTILERISPAWTFRSKHMQTHWTAKPANWSYQSSNQGLIFHASCCLIQETEKALPRFPVVAVIGLPLLAVNIAQSTLRAVFLASGIQCLTRSGKLWLKNVSLPNDRAILFHGFPELYNDSVPRSSVKFVLRWFDTDKESDGFIGNDLFFNPLDCDWCRALSCFTCVVRGNWSLKVSQPKQFTQALLSATASKLLKWSTKFFDALFGNNRWFNYKHFPVFLVRVIRENLSSCDMVSSYESSDWQTAF